MNAKGALSVVWNSWLRPEQIDRARAMADNPLVTEEEARAELRRLEECATAAHDMWLHSQ